MTRLVLPSNFAMQSFTHPLPVMPMADGRGCAVWLQPGQPGAPVRLRLAGLLPHRFYRVRPGHRCFARTDRKGVLRAFLQLDRATLVLVEPVI